MKLFQRRTALILISALILQALTCAFVFADDSYSETSGSEETETIKPEETGAEELESSSAPSDSASDTAGAEDISENGSSVQDTDKEQPEKSEQLSLDAEQDDPGNEQDPDSGQEGEEEEPLNGWVTEDGKKFYYVDGVKQTGMKHIGKYWYYFKSNGVMKTGWLTLNGKRLYFNPDNGHRTHGKKTINGKVFYFKQKCGVMAKGWIKVNGKKFYHDPTSGKRIYGGKKIGKYRYYFKLKSGAMKKGWLKLHGKKYYYNKKGHKVFGVHKIGKKTFYFNRTTGAKTAKGNYYLYNKIWTKSSSTNWLIYVSKGGRWVNVFRGRRKHWDIVKRYRCSIGAPGTPTPSGTYRVTCKVYHFGEGKGYTCWYATGFIGSAYLMHSVVCYRGTRTPSDGRLGMAISHGCIRMNIGNAKWIYDHVPGGTTVYIS